MPYLGEAFADWLAQRPEKDRARLEALWVELDDSPRIRVATAPLWAARTALLEAARTLGFTGAAQ